MGISPGVPRDVRTDMGAFDDFKARSIAVKHHWSRVDPATVLGRSDGPAVVVDRVELTPRLGQALAGYGPTFSRWTRGWMHPLYATLVLTDDGGGNRWLAIGFDLHAGTRWLVERVALGTAALGVGVESIFVTATHNHASPGGMYGVDFYDKLVANFESGGFDDSWPQEIVDRIVDRVGAMAARIAAGSGRNPRLVYGEALVWGPIWQRALCAHLANFGSVATMTAADIDDVVAKASEKLNGEKAPATNDPRFAAVDARVRTLTWESDGEPVAVFAFVAATPTMFHSGASISGGDGLGYAARYAELQLGAEGKKVYVSANGGPHGDTFLVAGTDVGAFIREREDAIAKWEKLAPFARKVVEVGARIGEGMVRAVAAGRAAPEDTEVRGAARLSPCPKPCFSERLMAGEPVSAFTGAPKNAAPVSGGGKAEPDPRVGVVGEVGNAMLAGDPFEAGVGARTWPNKSDTHPPPADLDRGVRGDYTGSDPQSPKTVALGNTILGVATAPEHRFSPWCTLRAARFDPLKVGKGLVLVGLPFEPTTRGGYAVETHALGLPNAPDHAVVACLAGDYIGYLVTREEYAAQMYEGGSSWFGRNTLRWVTDNLGDLLANPPERKFAEAWFSSRPKSIAADVRVPPPNPNLTPLDQVSDHWKIDAAAIAQGPDGADWLTVGGMWTAVATKTDHPRAGQDPWIRLMLRSGSTGQPEQARLDTNVPANDKCGWILLYRDIRAGEAFVRWRWQFHGPLPSTWKGKQLTFQILTALDGVAPHEVTTKWVKVG